MKEVNAVSEKYDSVELATFRLKLLGHRQSKTVLLSAGSPRDKAFLLPAMQKMASVGVRLLATPGTHDFLAEHGVATELVHKVSDRSVPNIWQMMEQGKLDLIVNILTGNPSYDEQSDAALIREYAVDHLVPMMTSADVAARLLDRLSSDAEADRIGYSSDAQRWNLRRDFERMVADRGGYASHHGHFDKAFLINVDNLRLGQVDMQKKWDLYRHLKEGYTHDDLVERIERCLVALLDQGATYCRSMVDADSIVGLKAISAAKEVQAKYRDRIDFDIGVQPLEGVVDKTTRKLFAKACEEADFVGGLPSRDRPQDEKHLDILFSIAKDLDRPVEVHVDQENNPEENESESLARAAMKWGYEGRVFAIHSVSVAAKPLNDQRKIAGLFADAGVGLICCPSAAISMRQLDAVAPLHNSIAPIEVMREAGVDVYLGIDNIADLFMPLVDGDLWFESRLLMEACRMYDLDYVADIASRRLPAGAK